MTWWGAILSLVTGAMLMATPARAALTKADLDAVALSPAPGAKVPKDLVLIESDGRHVVLHEVMGSKPTLLALVDFSCRAICGPLVAILTTNILRSGLMPGRDFNFVVIGIDPRQTPNDAAIMRNAELVDMPELRANAHFLSADAESFSRLSSAIGYRARYDEELRAFAHPADVLVLTPDGEVARVLPGLSVNPNELRTAVAQAGSGRLAALSEGLRILCYGHDPALALYAKAIRDALWGAGALTLLGLVGGIFLLEARRRSAAK